MREQVTKFVQDATERFRELVETLRLPVENADLEVEKVRQFLYREKPFGCNTDNVARYTEIMKGWAPNTIQPIANASKVTYVNLREHGAFGVMMYDDDVPEYIIGSDRVHDSDPEQLVDCLEIEGYQITGWGNFAVKLSHMDEDTLPSAEIIEDIFRQMSDKDILHVAVALNLLKLT